MFKKVEAYKTGDGKIHETLKGAVAHDIQRTLEEVAEGGHIDLRVLASHLVESPALRGNLVNLLGQLK